MACDRSAVSRAAVPSAGARSRAARVGRAVARAPWRGAGMPERDGYIPGVPCWVNTSQPDPEAATEFYAGLFGWELEDVMPEGSEAKYFIARIDGKDVAAVGSIPEGAPQMAMWNTYIWVDSADDTAAKVSEAGGK